MGCKGYLGSKLAKAPMTSPGKSARERAGKPMKKLHSDTAGPTLQSILRQIALQIGMGGCSRYLRCRGLVGLEGEVSRGVYLKLWGAGGKK